MKRRGLRVGLLLLAIIAAIAACPVIGYVRFQTTTYPPSGIHQRAWMAYCAEHSAAPNDAALFCIQQNGRMGFMDSSGAIVIEPTYEKVYPFSEGLAPVQINGRWGYINAQNQIVIEPRFAMPGFFREGLASVQVEFNQPWGYIDTTGRWIIEPRFDVAGQFVGGYTQVGFATIEGRIISRFADVGMDCRYRFINRKGEYVAPPTPPSAPSGPPPDQAITWDSSKRGYVDWQGQLVVPASIDWGGQFSEGLAHVRLNNAWGYIDRQGQLVIAVGYEEAQPFSEGLAAVRLNGLWGCIDRNGTMVIPPRFNWIYGFRNGLSEIALYQKSGYINRSGDYVWPPQD